MKRKAFLQILTLITIVVAPMAMYAINPLNTASLDVRARLFGVEPFRIAANSMAPTLISGDYILAKTYVYRNATPEINDVIVFQYPPNPSTNYIKRVIARGGERVRITNGKLLVNGAPVEQRYLDPKYVKTRTSLDMAELKVPEGKLFVLGDNRDNSNDSRYWGMVPIENVIGRATYIWMSNDPDRRWTPVK